MLGWPSDGGRSRSKFSTTKLPEIPLAWNQVHMIAGVVIAVLLILRTVIGADEGAGGFEVDLDRMYGLLVALIAAIGLAVGGFLKSKEPEDSRPAPAASRRVARRRPRPPRWLVVLSGRRSTSGATPAALRRERVGPAAVGRGASSLARRLESGRQPPG